MDKGFTIIKRELAQQKKSWLVTGAAGFIGSHLVKHLLRLDQKVVGLDDFSTGKKQNLEEIEKVVGSELFQQNFTLINGSIEDLEACKTACEQADIILHQAALGSVPRSINDPVRSTRANVTGFVQLAHQAHLHGIKRFVYASSSSVFGDTDVSPKREEIVGKLLSPYAATKMADELFAESFAAVYQMEFVGLRYFNVFGARQDPEGDYAAVIPKWISAVVAGEKCVINGDGETSRDFCFVDNVVQANLLAALVQDPAALNRPYNIALSEQTTLNQLFKLIVEEVNSQSGGNYNLAPEYRDFRIGDVRHSLADISKANTLLGYEPTHHIKEGLVSTVSWHLKR